MYYHLMYPLIFFHCRNSFKQSLYFHSLNLGSVHSLVATMTFFLNLICFMFLQSNYRSLMTTPSVLHLRSGISLPVKDSSQMTESKRQTQQTIVFRFVLLFLRSNSYRRFYVSLVVSRHTSNPKGSVYSELPNSRKPFPSGSLWMRTSHKRSSPYKIKSTRPSGDSSVRRTQSFRRSVRSPRRSPKF